jgi:hypothetical protein
MANKKPDPAPDKLDDQALQVLFKEYDTLRELFTQAEASAQSMFNFYLTLVSTVIGAVVVLIQFGGANLWIMVGLLSFTAAVGSVYLSALVGRYAHMARYAHGIDTLRRFLIRRADAPTPHEYVAFLREPDAPNPSRSRWLFWLFPTGTFQFFVAMVNSLALSMAVWLFLSVTGIVTSQLGRSALVVALLFLLSFTVYNIYSNLLIRTLTRRLNVRVDTASDLPLIAGKQ